MKPLKTEVAFTTPWFDLLAKTMKPGETPYYSLRLPDYTAVVAITQEHRVLAVRQYRPAVEQYTIELPAGLVDAGETPEDTARRELLEETGYQAGGRCSDRCCRTRAGSEIGSGRAWPRAFGRSKDACRKVRSRC